MLREQAGESYRRRAAECREHAGSAHDVAKRLNYLQIAEYWDDMAHDAEIRDQIGWQPLRASGRK